MPKVQEERKSIMQKLETLLNSVRFKRVLVVLCWGGLILLVVATVLAPALAARLAGAGEPLNAGDLLGYFGSLLGTVTSVATLVWTIRFTRGQIYAEQFTQKELERWRNIDEQFNAAIAVSHPLLMESKLMEILYSANEDGSVAQLRVLVNEAKIRRDTFEGSLTGNERLLLSEALDQLSALIKVLEEDKLQRCQTLVEEWYNVRKDRNGMQKKRTKDEIQTLRDDLTALSNGAYKDLLEQKRLCFNGTMGVYETINSRARRILNTGELTGT